MKEQAAVVRSQQIVLSHRKTQHLLAIILVHIKSSAIIYDFFSY